MIMFINSTGIESWHFDVKWPVISFLRNVDTTTCQSHVFNIQIGGHGSFKDNAHAATMWSFECSNESWHCFSHGFEGTKGSRHTRNNTRSANNG